MSEIESVITERPDTVHGRLLESIHLAGYTFERARSEFEWLLEDDRWKDVGPGFDDIDEFIRSLDFSEFRIAIEERKKLAKKLEAVRASQRATADMLGVSHTTVQNDLGDGGGGKDLPPDKQNAVAMAPDGDMREVGGKDLPPDETEPVKEPFQRNHEEVFDEVEKKTHKEKAAAERKNRNDGDEWYTPAWLFDSLGLTFSLDVCAPEDLAHTSVPAEGHYDRHDDGLAQDWYGTVWCNPPYSTPEPWARRMIEHDDGLLLVHMPMNGGWCVDVWHACRGIRLFQAIEFVRPDGSKQRPGYWLQLAAFGQDAADALGQMEIPPDIADNPRRVPSPMWARL